MANRQFRTRYPLANVSLSERYAPSTTNDSARDPRSPKLDSPDTPDAREEAIRAGIFTDDRPWGNFRQFSLNQSTTVKILTVQAGGTLSLQLHRQRDELWCVLDDGLRVEIDGVACDPKPGDELVILRGQTHRLSAPGSPGGRVLEIAFGHFDEADIERIDDIYGRAPEVT